MSWNVTLQPATVAPDGPVVDSGLALPGLADLDVILADDLGATGLGDHLCRASECGWPYSSPHFRYLRHLRLFIARRSVQAWNRNIVQTQVDT